MSDTSETLYPSAAIESAPVDLVASPATLQAKAAQAARVVPPRGGFASLATPGHWAVIDARGPEARSFLHNQLTNDVTHLLPGQAALGGFCSPKGRLLASMLYWPLAAPQPNGADAQTSSPLAVPTPTHHDDLAHWPDIRLLISADIAEAIRKRLHMFVLRTKVKLLDHSADVALFGLSARADDSAFDAALAALLIERGVCKAPAPEATDSAESTATMPESATVHSGSASLATLLSAAVPGAARTSPALTLVRHDGADGSAVTLLRLADAAGQRRWLLCVPAASRDAWLAALASRFGVLDPAHWDWLDIQSAEPRITAATQDAFVPQMINFEAIGGVNFRKGCYPGQEVVARSQYRGTVKRRSTLAHAEQARAGDEIIDLNDSANQGSAEQWQPCGRVVNAAAAPDGGVDCLIELKTATPSDAALRVVIRSALQPSPTEAVAAGGTAGAPETPRHDVSATPVTVTAALTVYGLPFTLPSE